MIGDSTMANKKPEAVPETGWGMVINEFVKKDATVHNHALNGRSSKSFINEKHCKKFTIVSNQVIMLLFNSVIMTKKTIQNYIPILLQLTRN